MRERDLDARLGAARTDLLAQIRAPELDHIRVRAAAHRRRRAVRAAGSALVAILVAGTAFAASNWIGGTREPSTVIGSPSGTTPTVSQPVWSGSGLTLLGLTAEVSDIPGDIYDIAFVDNNHGFALTKDCSGVDCRILFARTVDSGLNWAQITIDRQVAAFSTPANQLPHLLPVGADGLLLAGATDWFSGDGGVNWAPASRSDTSVPSLSKGSQLTLRPAADSPDCSAHQVDAVSALGERAPLAKQPPLRACWIAPVPAAGTAWWVGGIAEDEAMSPPAIAVTRDGGQTWHRFTFPGNHEGSWAQVATLGVEVYAIVVNGHPGSGGLRVEGLHRSVDNGQNFAHYGDVTGLTSLTGDLVPLLDGRLVAAAPDGWRISTADGTGWRSGAPDLPLVGRLQRTDAGWVAYNLFGSGWAAISPDGETWHKIHLK